MKILFSFIFCLNLLFANNIDTGLNLIKNKEYEKAGDFFMDLYVKDDKQSFSYLGELYAYNFNNIKDHCNVATYFLFQGLKEGDCRSSLVISNLYRDNLCIKTKDVSYKSEKYLKKYNECLKSN